jgi:hypothetical protein
MAATLAANTAVRDAAQRCHLWMALVFIVYGYGLFAVLGTMGLIPLVSSTPAWMAAARFLEGLGG